MVIKISLFPFLNNNIATLNQSQQKQKIPKEWAWDFEKNEFKLKDGKPYIVEGIEALKIWIYKVLNTQRYRYLAYTWDYGVEIEDLIGKPYTQEFKESEFKNMIEEALKINPYISGIKNIELSLTNDKVTANFDVVTTLGVVNIDI